MDVVRCSAKLDITIDKYRITLLESDDAVMGVKAWDYNRERNKNKPRRMDIQVPLEDPRAFEKITRCLAEAIDRAIDLYYSDSK